MRKVQNAWGLKTSKALSKLDGYSLNINLVSIQNPYLGWGHTYRRFAIIGRPRVHTRRMSRSLGSDVLVHSLCWNDADYVIKSFFPSNSHASTSISNDMRAFSKIFGKYKERKHPLLTTDPIVSHLEPEPATSTSIMMASAVQSVPTGSANVSTQDIQPTGITVSVQLGMIMITQTSSLIRLPNLESPLRFPLWRSMILFLLSVWRNKNPPSVTYSYIFWLLLTISRLGSFNLFPLALRQVIKLLNLLVLL